VPREHVNKRRFAYVGTANEGIFGQAALGALRHLSATAYEYGRFNNHRSLLKLFRMKCLRRTRADFTPPFLKIFGKFGKRHALCFPTYLIAHRAHKINGSEAFNDVGFILFHN
jgi:hypothetical protein